MGVSQLALDNFLNWLTWMFLGILSEQHFSKLSKLDDLRMEGNSGLVLNVSSTWIPPFQVHHLRMGSCNLGPSFPTWLKFPKNPFDLNMSNAKISGSVPTWLPNTHCRSLDLSNNKLYSSIPPNIGESNLDLEFRFLSGNQIIGNIPKSIGCMRKLIMIDLSKNSLTRSMPSSISNFSGLFIINLEHNNLSGAIPKSFG